MATGKKSFHRKNKSCQIQSNLKEETDKVYDETDTHHSKDWHR